jgi:hypothetical protein
MMRDRKKPANSNVSVNDIAKIADIWIVIFKGFFSFPFYFWAHKSKWKLQSAICFLFRTFASERVSLRLCKSVAANGKPFKCPSLDKRAKKHCSAFIWFALQNVLHLNISHCVVFMLNDEFLHRHSCTGTSMIKYKDGRL